MKLSKVRFNKYFPIIFLLITWYIPRQTAPGGYFDNFIFLRWITFIIIPLIFLFFLIYALHKRNKIFISNIALPMIALFGVIILSGLINKSSLLEIAFTILIYLRYPLLFIVFLNMNIDKDIIGSFINFFFFLLIIQIPEVFYRFFILGIRWDYISWTLGPWGSFDLGVYMLYATAILVAITLIVRMKFVYFLLIFLFFLIALMGEIKAFIFFAPLVAFFVIYNCFKNKISIKKFFIAIGLVLIIFIGFIFFLNLYEKIYPESKTMKQIVDMINPNVEGENFVRISSPIDIIKKVDVGIKNFLIGFGPGSSLAGSYTKERGLIYEFVQCKTQQVETFIDIGFIGIFTFFWLLISLIIVLRRHIKIEDDRTYIFLNQAVTGMWLFYAILGPFYDLVWRHDSPNYIFFFLTAALYSRYRKIKNENFTCK